MKLFLDSIFIDKPAYSHYNTSFLISREVIHHAKNPVRSKLLSVYLPEPLIRELSEVGEALDRATSDVAAEMIMSDLPRFKDRHRKAIREGRNSLHSHVASNSGNL